MLRKYDGIKGITELNDFSLPRNQQRLNVIPDRVICRFLFGLPKLFSATITQYQQNKSLKILEKFIYKHV